MELTSILPCTPEDYADLRELHKLAIKSSGWHYYSLKEVAARLLQIDDPDYTQILLGEHALLAKINDVLIGTSVWRGSNEHPQTAVITQLYIHPIFLNGGIATALIEKTEQAAYDKGFRWITAQADFNSRSFFSKLGYESKGFKGCDSDQATQYPLQIMTRHISAQYSKQNIDCTHTGSTAQH